MEWLVFVCWSELGKVERLDVVLDIGAFDLLLVRLQVIPWLGYCAHRKLTLNITYSAITKIVAICEVTPVLGTSSVFQGEIEVSLTDIILPLNLFVCEASADNTEEAGLVDLYLVGQLFLPRQRYTLTASRSSAASFCLPPGPSKVLISMVLMLAHAKFSEVFAGCCQ